MELCQTPISSLVQHKLFKLSMWRTYLTVTKCDRAPSISYKWKWGQVLYLETFRWYPDAALGHSRGTTRSSPPIWPWPLTLRSMTFDHDCTWGQWPWPLTYFHFHYKCCSHGNVIPTAMLFLRRFLKLIFLLKIIFLSKNCFLFDLEVNDIWPWLYWRSMVLALDLLWFSLSVLFIRQCYSYVNAIPTGILELFFIKIYFFY